MSLEQSVHQSHANALLRWHDAFPGFASGHDRRTSDSSLLGLLYGGLRHAAGHDWLNAGRRLIDRTYVDMLWHVQQLTAMRPHQPERIAAALDEFIRDSVALQWSRLWSLSTDERHALAVDWVEYLATHGFGSLRSEAAASRLLCYLCPMLPVWNLSTGHRLGLQMLGNDDGGMRYRAYAGAAMAAYSRLAPTFTALTKPGVPDGETWQAAAVQQVLDHSDWWSRRVFDQLLRDQLPPADAPLLGCDDSGQPLASPLVRN